jgi:hypothetical protein
VHEARLRVEVVVRLAGLWRTAPDFERALIELQDGAARVADEGGDRQQVKDAV